MPRILTDDGLFPLFLSGGLIWALRHLNSRGSTDELMLLVHPPVFMYIFNIRSCASIRLFLCNLFKYRYLKKFEGKYFYAWLGIEKLAHRNRYAIKADGNRFSEYSLTWWQIQKYRRGSLFIRKGAEEVIQQMCCMYVGWLSGANPRRRVRCVRPLRAMLQDR